MTSDAEQDTADRRYENGWLGWVQIGVIVVIILIAGAITLALSSGSGGPAGSSAEATTVPVRVISPTQSDHTPIITITGTVTATAQVDLSPQVGGRIVSVAQAARAGSSFSADEVLFEIDPRDYQVAVTRAQAALADASASLQRTEAEAQVARREWQAQYPDRPITSLAAREPQLAAARARQLAAEADLAQARLNLERTRVSFPFDGRVTESRLEAGVLVAAGQRYGAVYDASTLEIVAPIAPDDLARLGDREDASVTLRIEGASGSQPARIDRVGADLDARTRFIDLFIIPDDASTGLRPGQFAQIEIEGRSAAGVLILPAEAAPSINRVRVVVGGQIVERDIVVVDRPRGQLVVEPFDFGDGIIVSPVPEGAIGRGANILNTPAAGQ